MPTRFPTGVSFIRPFVIGAGSSAFTFEPGDPTPNVRNGSFWYINISSAITVTAFDSAERGQMFFVYSPTSGVATIATGGGIILPPTQAFSANTATGVVTITTSATGSIVMNSNETLLFVCVDNNSNCVMVEQAAI